MSATLSINQPVLLSSGLRRLLMLFVWLTFFLNGMVIMEPAPCDVLMIGFVLLMPLLGQVRFTGLHALLAAGFMVVVAFGLIAANGHEYFSVSVKHMLITLYLGIFTVVLAGYISKDPARHLKPLWSGYMCGAVIAALAGIIGYFDIIPGAYDLFTRYGRARGTFKDANVFGPYLVPAFLYCLTSFLTPQNRKGIWSLLLMGLFLFAILVSFSRGAWGLFAISALLYLVYFLLTTRSMQQRLRTLALGGAGLVVLAGLLLTAVNAPKVAELWEERTSINMTYDVGDEGRFAGHRKAANLILENPMGIGALHFGYKYHHELAHNVYLSMYLSSGWIGGTVFLLLIAMTLWLGLLNITRPSSYMNIHAICYCTFVGVVVESYIIDTDHWRLLYILMAVIWGCYAAARIEDAGAKKSAPAQAA